MKNMSLIKKIGILGLSVAIQQTSYSGWLSNLGQRIVNGAVNTVQTNVSRKVNKTVEDALDGKLGNNPNTKKEASVDTQGVTKGTTSKSNSKVSGQPSEEAVEGKITSTTDRGKAIRYSNKYEPIDLGTLKFMGERVYYNRLPVGTRKVDVDEFLDPGYYFILIDSISRTYTMGVVYGHESEGVGFGYGIINRKKIFNNGPREMLGDKDGIGYIVEILPNTQGHLELSMINNPNLNGSGTISIFKIPAPTLK